MNPKYQTSIRLLGAIIVKLVKLQMPTFYIQHQSLPKKPGGVYSVSLSEDFKVTPVKTLDEATINAKGEVEYIPRDEEFDGVIALENILAIILWACLRRAEALFRDHPNAYIRAIGDAYNIAIKMPEMKYANRSMILRAFEKCAERFQYLGYDEKTFKDAMLKQRTSIAILIPKVAPVKPTEEQLDNYGRKELRLLNLHNNSRITWPDKQYQVS